MDQQRIAETAEKLLRLKRKQAYEAKAKRERVERMTDAEICRRYHDAKDQKMQIGILADMNLCSKEQIMRILERNGINCGRARKDPGGWEARAGEIKSMLEQNYSHREIGEYYGCTSSNISMVVARLRKKELLPKDIYGKKKLPQP